MWRVLIKLKKDTMKIGIRKRMLGLFIGVICLFVLLIGRLAWVQLVDGARLQELASNLFWTIP